MQLKYQNDDSIYEVEFKKINKNIVQITGDFPVKNTGFTLSRLNKNDGWDYSKYTTVYREVEDGVQFSNDDSVYVEPVIPEPPEPTPEELAEIEERERVEAIYNEIDELKAQLESSDYMIIKCYEYSMVGLEMPYDVEQLHEQRQAIRDVINEKETEL